MSVIIPVYNRASLLRDAVQSVLSQTYKRVEVIIVDDGSTDGTGHVADQLSHRYPNTVRVIHQQNRGPGGARESGRKIARGEYIQYLDSDDLLFPQKFERQVTALRERPECGVAYCKTREYVIGMPPVEEASARTGERFETLFPVLLSGRCWQTVSPLFRREVCERAGPWSNLRQEEDWEYDARIGALGVKLIWCSEFLADFRHHSGQRAGGDSLGDPQKMRWRAAAHVLIYHHARRAGIDSDNVHMQRFARELFLLARQCGVVGLADESRELFELARAASGPERRDRWDFWAYGVLARTIGWRGVGKLACFTDRWRPPPL